jgi:LPXTG-motif cell wall-anchored protein
MASFPRGVLENPPPGSPLIGNNAVFYTVFGGVLLLVLLGILWLRRGRR